MMLNVNGEFGQQIKTSLIMLFLMTLVTGVLYPITVTIIAQSFFSWRANGSLLIQNGVVVGSELIGQQFTAEKYFWGRPSATLPYAYNAMDSRGSNYGPLNPALITAVNARAAMLASANAKTNMKIPIDLVTASASGLDPEISVRSAIYQATRIATARKINNKNIHSIIRQHSKNDLWNVFGESRVNVLKLNLALDLEGKES